MSFTHSLAALLLVLSVPVTQAPTQTSRQPKQYTIEQFLNTTSVSGASFSADESRILFSSNKTGIWNAYTIPVGGGSWTAVTSSTTDSTYGVSFFPTDDRILITRDQGGNELNHLYVRTAAGEERDLTPGDKLKASFMQWSADGSAFFVQTNERDAKAFDIYRYDAKTYSRTLFYENKEAYFPAQVSDDGKWLSLVKITTTNDTDVYVWSAATKQTTRVTPHQGQASFSPAGFDPASAHLYYTSNDSGEFARLRRYALAGGQQEDVEKADWDIVNSEFSHTGKYRATLVNKDARPEVRMYETATNRLVPLPAVPNGGITAI